MCKGVVAAVIKAANSEISYDKLHNESIIHHEKNAAQLLVEAVQLQLAARKEENMAAANAQMSTFQGTRSLGAHFAPKRQRIERLHPTLATIAEEGITEDDIEGSSNSDVSSLSQETSVASDQVRADSSDAGADEEDPLMIAFRGLPDHFTDDSLEELLDTEGFRGRYDLAYLSPDLTEVEGSNCAVVIFRKPRNAERARAHFQIFTQRL